MTIISKSFLLLAPVFLQSLAAPATFHRRQATGISITLTDTSDHAIQYEQDTEPVDAYRYLQEDGGRAHGGYRNMGIIPRSSETDSGSIPPGIIGKPDQLKDQNQDEPNHKNDEYHTAGTPETARVSRRSLGGGPGSVDPPLAGTTDPASRSPSTNSALEGQNQDSAAHRDESGGELHGFPGDGTSMVDTRALKGNDSVPNSASNPSTSTHASKTPSTETHKSTPSASSNPTPSSDEPGKSTGGAHKSTPSASSNPSPSSEEPKTTTTAEHKSTPSSSGSSSSSNDDSKPQSGSQDQSSSSTEKDSKSSSDSQKQGSTADDGTGDTTSDAKTSKVNSRSSDSNHPPDTSAKKDVPHDSDNVDPPPSSDSSQNQPTSDESHPADTTAKTQLPPDSKTSQSEGQDGDKAGEIETRSSGENGGSGDVGDPGSITSTGSEVNSVMNQEQAELENEEGLEKEIQTSGTQG